VHYSVLVVIDWPGTVIAINVGGALMSQPSFNYSNQGRIVNLIHFVGVNLLEPVNHAPGRYGSKGAAVKNATISPVIDCAGIVGFVVEYMPNYFEAYFIGELIGTFSSKVEAAAELLLHARRGRFAQ
jgi:hypothetical protein